MNTHSVLWSVAQKSLEANTVHSDQGPITVAGGHQFKTFWVRDFCYAVPGLMALGLQEQVKNQIKLALHHQAANGLIARGFDVINPKLRVTANSLKFGFFVDGNYAHKKLQPEFLGEHKTPALDSNLLILLACCQWTDHQQSSYFWDNHSSQLQKAFEYVLSQKGDTELIQQPAFSDWQDSAKREGATLYMNLLFLRVLGRLQKNKISWAMSENIEKWTELLWNRFYDKTCGLFCSQESRAQYSLETQLWAIEENTFKKFISQSQLWANLITSPLWNPLPGRPVAPDYGPDEISWTTKSVGLTHYHDQFYWSWLMAEALRVSAYMDSEIMCERISKELERLAANHNTIHEVYEMKQVLVPVSRPLYKSEFPFSWGAAKVIEALESIKKGHKRN